MASTEEYIIDKIQTQLFDNWVHEGIRKLPEVQEAGQKWARDLLTMITMLQKQFNH